MKIHKNISGVEYWFDRTNNGGRSWWAIKVDKEGNQIGDAKFAADKKGIIAITKELAE